MISKVLENGYLCIGGKSQILPLSSVVVTNPRDRSMYNHNKERVADDLLPSRHL